MAVSKVLLNEKPSDVLRRYLGKPVTMELLKEYPELLKELQAGMTLPSYNDIIGYKLMRHAADPKKLNLPLIAMILERVEGRAVQGEAPDDGGRAIEEKLDEITRGHLNDLGKQFLEAGGVAARETGGKAPRPAAGQASKLLDLPRHGPARAEGSGE